MDRLDEAPDEELLAATAAGDAEAFACFYRRHENGVLLFFLRRTGNPETAADLAAEVFAAALASAPRFRPGPRPAASWLYGIANHKLASSRRRGRVEDRARRRLGMERLVLTDEMLERVEQLADLEPSHAAMQGLLARLPGDQREAIGRRILDEQPYDEIAIDLQCSSAVVRQRVSRGLRSLRGQLTKEAKWSEAT